jgi:hypothetical protein
LATVVEAFLLTNACPAKRVTDVICDGTMVCAKATGWPMQERKKNKMIEKCFVTVCPPEEYLPDIS